MPGYVVVQLAGAVLAAWFLQAVVGVSATDGGTYPAAGYSAGDAFAMEVVLTLGLVSVILGTASGAQNLGAIAAIGVGAYIALAGLWGSPISGASMNPARSLARAPSAPTSAPGGSTSPARWSGPSWPSAPRSSSGAAVAAGPARPPPRVRCSPRSSGPISPERRRPPGLRRA